LKKAKKESVRKAMCGNYPDTIDTRV